MAFDADRSDWHGSGLTNFPTFAAHLQGIQTLILTYSNIGANFTRFPPAFAFIIIFGLPGWLTRLFEAAGLIEGLNISSIGGLMMVDCHFQICLGLLKVFHDLKTLTPEIEEAARLLPVSQLTFCWRIGLPVLTPSLIGTLVLLFANAMGTCATAFALAGAMAPL